GREVLVSAGVYYLGNHVTIENQIRFEGTVTMPADKRFVFQKNFDYATYVDAFGDEELAFKKAFQALLNFSDHESLDLCGRRIAVSAPIDMQAAEGSKTVFAIRRVIRNGQFQPVSGSAWDPTVVTTTASYSAADPLRLTNVVNIGQIAIGSLVNGAGVGREIYVRAVDPITNTVTLSQELYGAAANQTYTFTRFKYLLDFSGFDDLAQFVIDDVEFLCDGTASGIMLAKEGLTFHLRDCFINKPRDRGLTSSGGGCQGMMIDRCQIISNEQNLPVEDRTTIGFNVNANDVKIRDNRAVRFKHFCVLAGSGNLITGNHWFHGDNTSLGVRKAGIVFTSPNCKSVVTGNYIDNNFIEWTNEHDATPALGVQYSFGGLTITGNIFTAADVAPWFTWIVVKPFGAGHYIHGFSVTGNVFRAIGGSVDRVEAVDTTFAGLDFGRFRNIIFSANTFTAVNNVAVNPASVVHSQATAAQTWVVEGSPYMPFGGRVRNVEAVCPDGKLTDANGQAVYELPYAEPEKGAAKTQANLVFKTACKGTIRVTLRTDNPL
ncbi:MAG TPA: right-handed parallel beta-helix repeat-containing protein, partial [Paracoccaceae bacterium]|nr:right-handed parallel beta-helix repeat-containing protein [Paracoccaceae bacterium]